MDMTMVFYFHVNFSLIPQHFLQKVKEIDLSHNIITKIDHFQYCYKLSRLNLSYNRIQSTTNIFEYLGNLKELNLRNNLLISTEGLEKLFAIETLDLSDNNIARYPIFLTNNINSFLVLKKFCDCKIFPFYQSCGSKEILFVSRMLTEKLYIQVSDQRFF